MYDDLAGSGDLLREPAPPDDAGAIRFRRERDLGEVVNVTFRFLRANARELGRGLLFIVGPVALVAAFLSAKAQLQMEQAFQEPINTADPSAVFGSSQYVTGLLLMFVALAVMQLLLQAVVLGYVERYRRGEAGHLTPTVLWEATKVALGPVASTLLIAVGLVLALFFAISLVTAIVPVLGLILSLAGMAVVVYFVPVLMLLYVERVAEGDRFWEGVEETRGLVRGHWWRAVGVLFVAGLIVIAIMIVLSIPGAVLEAALSFNTLEGGGALGLVVLAVNALVGVFIYAAYVIPVTASAFLYFDLVERKQGTGLLGRLDALAGPPEVAEAAPSRRPPEATPEEETPVEGPPPARGFRGGGFLDEGDERGGAG